MPIEQSSVYVYARAVGSAPVANDPEGNVFEPLQSPLATHTLAPVALHLSVVPEFPSGNEIWSATNVTTGFGGSFTVRVALAVGLVPPAFVQLKL